MKCTEISVSYAGKRKTVHLKQAEGIPRAKLDGILADLGQEAEHLCCAISEEDTRLALDVEFSRDRAAFIGWIDEYAEEVWYFDNGSGAKEPAGLLINVCPQARLLCHSAEDTAAVIAHFCETGERHPGFGWIEDGSL